LQGNRLFPVMHGDYTHTAIAVHNREQAVALQAALAA
jgi:hypothetical protein